MDFKNLQFDAFFRWESGPKEPKGDELKRQNMHHSFLRERACHAQVRFRTSSLPIFLVPMGGNLGSTASWTSMARNGRG